MHSCDYKLYWFISLQELEKHWKTIREEGLAQMDSSGAFLNEDENLREAGDWKQFTLYSRGTTLCFVSSNIFLI